MKTYTDWELVQCAADDWHGVRDEGFRRQDLASKKVAKLQKQLTKAQAELESAQRIIEAAYAAARRAA